MNMKKMSIIFSLAAAVLLFMAPVSSYAWQSRGRVGASIGVTPVDWRGGHGGWHGHRGYWGPHFYWGGPVVVGSPWLYPYGYYYEPPPVVVQPQTPTYVQPEPQENYWYYCQNPQGYYPYVQSCPSGWMKVVPQPAPPKQ
jgi:hypothetical protein